MEYEEAARIASHDQVEAAHDDVVAILSMITRDQQRWSRIDEGTQRRIEALLERLFADEGESGRVCPHARRPAFDRAPRPLVLDTVRRVLACWEQCYWQAANSEAPGEHPDAACFDCGRWLARVDAPDLFIAYGPLLVAGALCQQCREAGSEPRQTG